MAISDTTTFKFGAACLLLSMKLNSSCQRTFLGIEEGDGGLHQWSVPSRENFYKKEPLNKTPSWD